MTDTVSPDSIEAVASGAVASGTAGVPEETASVPTGPIVEPGALPAGVTPEDAEDLSDLWKRHGMADSTRKAYGVQWRGFVRWCRDNGATALPAAPAAVAKYLKARAD